MVFELTDELAFPDPRLAEPETGLLAIGGDLGSERVLLAYRNGIFPWPHEGCPMLWFSPDPRCVLCPDRLRVTKSMARIVKSGQFEITFDRVFRDVMTGCRTARRPGEAGTWITDEMIDVYCRLHGLGHAWSAEAWHEGKLVGGCYGVRLGRVLCGESMFSRMANASKAALMTRIRTLDEAGELAFVDCQLPTPHLLSLGAEAISRQEYLVRLQAELDRA